ncbi:unnamed protein product [Rotaria sp. Silwood1]|nr:unnamed protein product [Rotaria sp. Silwood1]
MTTTSSSNDATSTSHGTTNTFEELKMQFTAISKQSINPEDTIDKQKQMWLHSLELWTKMIHTVVKGAVLNSSPFKTFQETLRTIMLKVHIQNLLYIDGSIAHKTFFCCLNLLDMPALHQHLLSGCKAGISDNDFLCDSVTWLLVLCFEARAKNPFSNNILEKYEMLLDALKSRVEKRMSIDSSQNGQEFVCHFEEILVFFWNISDQTIIIPSMLRIGLASGAVRWLANCGNLSVDERRPLISIIYNIVRHDDGCDELNKHNAIEIVNAYRER